MFMDSRRTGYEDLLGVAIRGLDIPDEVHARAVSRYAHAARFVSGWLAEYSGQIYTQGSIRLGTMVAPVDPDREYDIDLVCLLELLRHEVSKAELKRLVGEALAAYVASNPDGSPTLKEHGRCWTLIYPGEPFHMDVLPAIPNDEVGGTAILLTDKDLQRWQPSNPIGYATWFRDRMSREYKTLRETLASRGIDIEAAPPSEAKTNLQLTVQALKRHRDLHFFGRDIPTPATIIITTLAARAYEPAETLLEVLTAVSAAMPDYIERRDDELWVPNPALEDENFAHRWTSEPERKRDFYAWLEAARRDFAGYLDANDTGVLLESVSRSLGEGAARTAGEHLGQRLNRARKSGIGLTSVGALTTTPAHAAPRHTFHGDPPSPR